MCGIYGQISTSRIDRNDFKKNLSKLHHRGPDDSGIFIDTNIAFGHTRLSILDLSASGHQPMIDLKEKYVIIYNGEIYNFDEIKNNLQKKGYIFKSNSDTEVILYGFIEYGEKIVEEIKGMFAFAIYNKETQKIFLARDHMGIKPLYYFKDNDNFIFSSEIKCLKNYSNGIDSDSKILFLSLGSVPEPLTIYEKIFSFPKGHYGYFSKNELKITRYYQDEYEPKTSESYSDIVQNTKELLHKSVERHLISDAPIGTFLSGGLDSSAITAIAAQYKSDLHTLSLDFHEKDLSEKYYQELIVKKYNTNHTNYIIDEKIFLENIHQFIASIDQPTVDGLNTFFVSKAAIDSGLKAVLSGVGGDEIFYGYGSFKMAKKINALNILPLPLIDLITKNRKLNKLDYLRIGGDISKYLPLRTVFTPIEIAKILDISVEDVYCVLRKNLNQYNELNIKNFDDKISFFELNLYMKNQLLRDSDIFGMANSLEIRVPLLDKDLVDYVLKINPKHKYRKNINKSLLADATKDLVPSEIINRKKRGFELPFKYWLQSNIHDFEIDQSVKNDFIDNKIHWSKVWSLFIINNFS
jgi:asparagine synthase (glutamine-hydrolysing)